MMRSILALLSALCVAACGDPSPPPQEIVQQAPNVAASGSAQVSGVFVGGETRADVVRHMGQPHEENVVCSKDRECARKIVSLKYCFPDKATCSQSVEFALNQDDHLYRITSTAPAVPSASFPAYLPDWLKQ